jgi:hypothetical protein
VVTRQIAIRLVVVRLGYSLPLNSYTIGDCLKAYMAQEECEWDCSACDCKKAIMVKSIEKITW